MRDLLDSPAIRLVLAIHFCWHMSASALLIIPKWLHGLGYSEGHIGLVMGIAGISSLLFTPYIGRVLDRFNRVYILRAAMALIIPLILLLPLAARLGYGWLEVLRLLQGIAFGLAFPAAGTLVADFAQPSMRVRALGLFGIVTQVTQAGAPGLSEWAAAAWGYDLLFVLAASGAALAFLLTYRLEGVLKTLGAPQHDEPTVDGDDQHELSLHVPLSVYVIGTGVTYGAMVTFAPVMLLNLGVNSVGPFFMAVSLSSVFVRTFFGGLGDQMDQDRLILFTGICATAAIMGAALVGLAAPSAAVAAWLGIACGLAFGAAAGLFYPVANVRYVEFGPSSERGKRMAYYASTYAAGITAGNLLLGFIAQHAGFATMYASVALLNMLAALWFAVAVQRNRHLTA